MARFDHGAVGQGEMTVLVKRVRIQSEIQRVGSEEVMIDDGYQGIKQSEHGQGNKQILVILVFHSIPDAQK